MPPEKEGDVFDKALAPFNHDDYEDESSTSQSETSSSVPSEKTSETFSRSGSSKSSSGSSSATPKRTQRRMSARERKIRSRKISAKSSRECKHNPFTHFPKDPDCDICQQSKMTQSRMSSHSSSEEEPLKGTGSFGELVTMDHKVNIEKDEGCPYFENEKKVKPSTCW